MSATGTAPRIYRRPKPAAYFKPSRTINDVGRFLRLKLEREKAGIESFGASYLLNVPPFRGQEPLGFTGASTWESARMRYRWVAAYAVTGNSEGHYVHISLVCEGADETGKSLPAGKVRSDRAVIVFLGKTFNGMDAAFNVARRVAGLLDA